MYLTIKTQIVILCLFLVSGISFAQGQQRFDNEKIEAFKITFFTQKLDLSAEEAKIFWPIYNDFQREQKALRSAHMEKMISFTKVKDIDELTDTEIQTKILNDFDFKQRDLNVEKKYYYRLKTSLPLKTVGKFYRAQEAFKSELLKQFRSGGGGGPRRNNN
jgi:hypothetical protein